MAHNFEHLKIPLEAIKSATNNFADESCIGKGGFGRVYKGKIGGSDGHTMVALKRLDPRFGQGVVEFWKEVMLLSQYKHNNIVYLLGFCDEGGEKILAYEYVPNKSLDRYISSDNLRWIQRLKICIGAAHGLAYLHNPNGAQQRVLHCDIKSANILLDENWNAKISDFGLSKLGPANQEYTFLYSNPTGTFGYIDPLYAETGLLTKESDVYSFGVVLFEVLCGRLCIGYKNVKHLSFAELARKSYEQNTINEIVYVNMKDEIDPRSLQAFAKIAYQCLKRDPDRRPLMSHIVGALETALDHQESKNYQVSSTYLPPEPSMVLESNRGNFREFSKSSSQHSDEENINVTVNELPIPDRLVKKAEKLAGHVQPGDYWYDPKAGFWGMMGGPCRGIIPPFIEEFNYPMPEKCADGNTNVFVNGRELHQKDLDLLVSRGLPTDADRSYLIDISGKVFDEESGEELEGLGKLAPTVERKKRGFGMRPQRTAPGS